ncbi:hypothetical protein HDK90DRAFT_464369 [Phyllosticta capitalensis]|uniref:Uncharacterized protein n=1 Tax=Phyllosticta capitalensis TaxID=121624 RepID=A0ABR1YXQ2_9PEZI
MFPDGSSSGGGGGDGESSTHGRQANNPLHSLCLAGRQTESQLAGKQASKQASKKEGGGETKQRLSMRRMRMDAMPRGQGKTRCGCNCDCVEAGTDLFLSLYVGGDACVWYHTYYAHNYILAPPHHDQTSSSLPIHLPSVHPRAKPRSQSCPSVTCPSDRSTCQLSSRRTDGKPSTVAMEAGRTGALCEHQECRAERDEVYLEGRATQQWQAGMTELLRQSQGSAVR